MVALTNASLQERHWGQISDVLGGVDIQAMRADVQHGGCTLGKLMALDVGQFVEELETIATTASQESVLEGMMAKIKDFWKVTEFELKPYKDYRDCYILGSM